MTVLAALASTPSRAKLLPRTLASLRPQVDRLCVYLNGYETAPACVTELADDHVLDPHNSGAEHKLWWSESHDGLYLSCDDDFVYPADYAQTMAGHVAQWDGRVICTAHGRCYEGTPKTVHDVVPGSIGTFQQDVSAGRLINHGGTGVMAWDAGKIRIPREWPLRNIADMQVAIWAQQAHVPMYLVPHSAAWLKALAPNDPRGLYRDAQRDGFRRRNKLLLSHYWFRWQE